jgi:glycosyltransferase involved in cell wall biosynthesis
MKVLHLITSLAVGGAETMLRNVVLGLPWERYEPLVISLTNKDAIGDEIESAGIHVLALGGRRGILLPQHLRRLWTTWRSWQPDIVHAWMYHANVVAEFAVWAARREARPSVITSVRGALDAPDLQKASLRLIRRLDARWSSRADAIVFNSVNSACQHVAMGYDESKVTVVPNGFDTTRFSPDPQMRARVRAELGLDRQTAIGVIARFHPLKGHELFLRAAADVARARKDCVFVLAGRGCDSENEMIARMSRELGIGERLHLLGECSDVRAVLSALDIAVCSSHSESFPNSIGEAMACGVPCVVTDVGDCARLVGDGGVVVPRGNKNDLAQGILQIAQMAAEQRSVLGLRARERIIMHFSLRSVLTRFSALYDQVVEQRAAQKLTRSAPSRHGDHRP